MTHPINPPEDLIKQWRSDGYDRSITDANVCTYIAQCAAQWGADEELKAVQEWLVSENFPGMACQLYSKRRPKPLTLKQQAFKALDAIEGDFNTVGDRAAIIRKALEALNDD